MGKKKDPRPICYCKSYSFPHKIGGKCKGQTFAQFYFYNVREACSECNCLNDDRTPISCDVVDGTESIKEAECYRERVHSYPSEKLPLQFEFEEDDEIT